MTPSLAVQPSAWMMQPPACPGCRSRLRVLRCRRGMRLFDRPVRRRNVRGTRQTGRRCGVPSRLLLRRHQRWADGRRRGLGGRLRGGRRRGDRRGWRGHDWVWRRLRSSLRRCAGRCRCNWRYWILRRRCWRSRHGDRRHVRLAIRPDHRITERGGRDSCCRHRHIAYTRTSHRPPIACPGATLPAIPAMQSGNRPISTVPTSFSVPLTPFSMP